MFAIAIYIYNQHDEMSFDDISIVTKGYFVAFLITFRHVGYKYKLLVCTLFLYVWK